MFPCSSTPNTPLSGIYLIILSVIDPKKTAVAANFTTPRPPDRPILPRLAKVEGEWGDVHYPGRTPRLAWSTTLLDELTFFTMVPGVA